MHSNSSADIMPQDFQGTDSLNVDVFESDLRPSDITTGTVDAPERVAVIRTSDRILYKRCRRRWGWNSHLKDNLGPKTNASPLWFGSGFHFAMEDFHGEKNYDTIVDAFYAYVEATKKHDKRRLPGDWQEHIKMGEWMLSYYADDWLKHRDPLKTFVYKGVPQVEVNFRIDIPWERGKFGYDRVVYSGTIDRVSIDEYGMLWLMEYKTAKIIQTLHLPTDPQVGAYVWAGTHIYPGHPVAGVIYQQHRKVIPHAPDWTSNGFSTNKQQMTTPELYRESLKKVYGSVEDAPMRNVDFLNQMIKWETPTESRFIRRDSSRRNEHQMMAEGTKIMMEIEEMLNPDIGLYPNPDRSCPYLCPFTGPCVSMDDGGDWQYELELLMAPRDRSYDEWRKYLPTKDQLPLVLAAEAEANRPLFE